MAGPVLDIMYYELFGLHHAPFLGPLKLPHIFENVSCYVSQKVFQKVLRIFSFLTTGIDN